VSLQEFRDPRRQIARFRWRVSIAAACVLAGAGLVITRLAYLQIVQYDYYNTKAEANRISIVPVTPNRGLIFDRKGTVLARNYSAYTLEIAPDKVKDLPTTLDGLATVIEIQPKDRRRFMKQLEENRHIDSLPIRTRLTDVELARFAAHRYRFPGVEVNARLFRQYPLGEVASHVLGYIGRINQSEKAEIDARPDATNYRGTEFIGKTGVEQSFERRLHGVTGIAQVEIDANGRGIRTLSRTNPIPGDNLHLTLDIDLQQVAEQAFAEHRGALVAIDPRDGGVLALVSRPGFDPNLFVDGIDPQNWDLLNTSSKRPLNNRALTGQYPPGSTFKPFMALAALELGKRTPHYTIHDPGFFTLPGVAHHYRDWKKGGHGAVDLRKSVIVSCDTYYYGLAQDLGIDAIHDYIAQFGLGALTGIDIEGEKPGLLPSQAWKMRRFKQKWYTGDTISVGIGQGYNLATPLQLAHATAAIASGGVAYKPRVVAKIHSATTEQVEVVVPEIAHRIAFKPENLELVRSAMIGVTQPGGTAARAGAGSSYEIAGKTGTAQVIGMKRNQTYVASALPEKYRDHALFIAFAPAHAPTIALGVLVENGGHGSSSAAPIARQVLDYYILGKRPETPALKAKEAELDADE
jgi:penicillin-binding protein 2